ncbi:MAG: hypothetical protein LPD71_05375 [Shewanella sp.]|nr:hypothetical protein [Shewanella sp.]MCF1431462.1 hypothetical protein [Shewanella sp.]MCF1438182.1 hypothetical protein [Shewanella sp.]MCF1457156.1 hypothetical protein [Shewanella sp.]
MPDNLKLATRDEVVIVNNNSNNNASENAKGIFGDRLGAEIEPNAQNCTIDYTPGEPL